MVFCSGQPPTLNRRYKMENMQSALQNDLPQTLCEGGAIQTTFEQPLPLYHTPSLPYSLLQKGSNPGRLLQNDIGLHWNIAPSTYPQPSCFWPKKQQAQRQEQHPDRCVQHVEIHPGAVDGNDGRGSHHSSSLNSTNKR